ncbi:MAG TPA: hypothetical protein DEO32_03965 [Ruminococcaceae bacterium]|nr:hypothetical protein [Oscillospiraceae bacterium]
MSKNALIKKQARTLLRGNWVPVIIGWTAVALAVIAVVYLQYTALYAFDQIDSDGKFYNSYNFTSLVIVVAAYLALALCSPLLNGAIKLSADLAVNRETSVADMFFFFKEPVLYFKTISFNMITGLFFLGLSKAFDVYMYASHFFSAEAGGNGVSIEVNAVLIFALVLSAIIKVFLYLLIVHFQLLTYALEPGRGVMGCTFMLLPFVFKNFGKALSLMLSFAGWFALCFFVVPALYTVPYFITASANETKWLLKSN